MDFGQQAGLGIAAKAVMGPEDDIWAVTGGRNLGNFSSSLSGCSTVTLMPVSCSNFLPTSARPLYPLSPLIQMTSLPSSILASAGAAMTSAASALRAMVFIVDVFVIVQSL